MSIYGASFSLHRCQELGLDKRATLQAALDNLGLRRFRLMSYWNIHEQHQGVYTFDELDWQLDMVAAAGGEVTFCLGLRQPRWPEFHMPAWAENLPTTQWHAALLKYIEVVVNRYKNHPAITSWQLENEALLKTFGHGTNIDYDRRRLKREFALVKSLDPTRPIIMTLSGGWGIPVFGPKPDLYATSIYRVIANANGAIVHAKNPAFSYQLQAFLIRVLRWRSMFNHELQAEPWLTKGITEVPVAEQLAQMGPEQLAKNLQFARATHLSPIDLWGLEWWYWLRTKHNESGPWNTIKQLIAT